jgi:hypothetical protein
MAMAESVSPESVTVTLSQSDLALVRSALQEYLAIYTRHEHVIRQIEDLLKRLPGGESGGVGNKPLIPPRVTL